MTGELSVDETGGRRATMPLAMQLQPYLFFDGRCEEAIDFYRKALGAEVTAQRRPGADAIDEDVLFSALWHGR